MSAVVSRPVDGTPPRLAAALRLLALGLSLLPLEPRGKLPHFEVLVAVHGSKRWGQLRRHPATAEQVRAWFEHDPETNYGVLTEGVTVVDVDVPARFDQAHPATPFVRTGRGLHLYFEGTAPTDTTPAWGDVKGTGSYVVGPGSVHPSGAIYAEGEIGFGDLPLAPLPACFRRAVVAPAAPVTPGTTGPGVTTGCGVTNPAQSDDAALAVLRLLGRPARLSSPGQTGDFQCLVPGHRDGQPSATLYRATRDGVRGAGAYRYRCRGCGVNLSLAELYATVRGGTGEAVSFEGRTPTAARWLARLWHDAGTRPVPRTTIQPPTGCSANARTLAEGFGLLCDLRAAHGDHDPVPFTRGFGEAWCGLSESQAKRGMKELRDSGWLTEETAWQRSVGFTYRSVSSQAASGSSAPTTGAAGSRQSNGSGSSTENASRGSVTPSRHSRSSQTDRLRSKPCGPSSDSHAQIVARSVPSSPRVRDGEQEPRVLMPSTVAVGAEGPPSPTHAPDQATREQVAR